MGEIMDNNIDNNVKVAIDMINLGEIEKGVELLHDLSKKGCSIATRKLVELYAGGDNVPLSDEEILSWLLSQADSNEIWINRLLGIMYLNGKGVKKNIKEAKMWFEMAAVQGDSTSQFYLGWLYECGYELCQSNKQATYWYMEAAKHKNMAAMKRLGKISLINMQYDEAIRWYEEAAKQHDADAAYELGFIYFVDTYGKENEKRSMEWFKCAADYGSEAGEKTIEAYKIMSENGDNTGFYNLGRWFENEKEIEKAVAFYHKATEYGNADAPFCLGRIYLYGQDTIKCDYAKAFKFYKQAADKGNPDAQNSLGYMYSCGLGVKENNRKAYMLFRKAAKQGQIDAVNNLAKAYEIGYGTRKNYKKAKQWYSLAESMGNTGACNIITNIEKKERLEKSEIVKKRWVWIAKLIVMILIGIVFNILFAIGAEKVIPSSDIGPFLLLFTGLFICSVIMPLGIDHFIDIEISNNAKSNRPALSIVYILELILFIIGIFLIKMNMVPEWDYLKVGSYNPIAVTFAFILGMIVLNFKVFSLANKVNNPTGIIFLSIAIGVLYSILIYTILIDVIISILMLFIAAVGIGFMICMFIWCVAWYY